MTLANIGLSAKSLADYIERYGEASDLSIIDGSLKVIRDQLTVVRQDRLSGMVEDSIENSSAMWGKP